MNRNRVKAFRKLYEITEVEAQKIVKTLNGLPSKYANPIANKAGCSTQVVRNVRLGITGNVDILALLIELVKENEKKINSIIK